MSDGGAIEFMGDEAQYGPTLDEDLSIDLHADV